MRAEQESLAFVEQFLQVFQEHLSRHFQMFQETTRLKVKARYNSLVDLTVFGHGFKKMTDQVEL